MMNTIENIKEHLSVVLSRSIDVMHGNEDLCDHLGVSIDLLYNGYVDDGGLIFDSSIPISVRDRVIRVVSRKGRYFAIKRVWNCFGGANFVWPPKGFAALLSPSDYLRILDREGLQASDISSHILVPAGAFLPGPFDGFVILMKWASGCEKGSCGFFRDMLKENNEIRLTDELVQGMHDAYHGLIFGEGLGSVDSRSLYFKTLCRLLVGVAIIRTEKVSLPLIYRNIESYAGKIAYVKNLWRFDIDVSTDSLEGRVIQYKVPNYMEQKLKCLMNEQILYPKELFNKSQLGSERFVLSQKLDGEMVLVGTCGHGVYIMHRNLKCRFVPGTFPDAVVIAEEVKRVVYIQKEKDMVRTEDKYLVLLDVLEYTKVSLIRADFQIRLNKLKEMDRMLFVQSGVQCMVQNYMAVPERSFGRQLIIQNLRSWVANLSPADNDMDSFGFRLLSQATELYDPENKAFQMVLMINALKFCDGYQCESSQPQTKADQIYFQGLLTVNLGQYGGGYHEFKKVRVVGDVKWHFLLSVFDLVVDILDMYLYEQTGWFGTGLELTRKFPCDGYVLTSLERIKFFKVKDQFTVDFEVLNTGLRTELGLRQKGRVVPCVIWYHTLEVGKIVEMACVRGIWRFVRYRKDKIKPNNIKMLQKCNCVYVPASVYLDSVCCPDGKLRRY